MLSANNLSALEERHLNYIVGARLKNLSKPLQEKILSLDFAEQSIHELRSDDKRLIISYSKSRASRAMQGRKRSVARLEDLIAKNKAIKKHPYLDFTIKDKPVINHEAIDSSAKWDGIKGYITNNADLSPTEVIEHYKELYKVEQSFRMSKTDLGIRPAFHYKRERIEAHVIICMLSLCLLRILEEKANLLGMTLGGALDEIKSAKSAIVQLGHREFRIPPAYTPTFKQLIKSLDLVT